MIKKFMAIFMAVLTISLGSCVKDDIDDLQDQINDLNEKVTELEEEQRAALQQQISAMQALITDLQSENTTRATEYQALLDNLSALETTVEENKSAIYYGNLVSDTEYAEFAAQGASIVTGRVIVASNEQVAQLANLETVGGSFTVNGGTAVDVPMLKTVAGDIVIEGLKDTAVVSLPALSIAGANLTVTDNDGLTSFTTPALSFVADDLTINGYYGNNVSALSALDLAGASVMGDVAINGTNGADIALGTLGGNLIINNIVPGKLIVSSEVIGGDLSISYVAGDFSEITFDNLTTIEGDLVIVNNQWAALGDGMPEGITEIVNIFEALETIGGGVEISGNEKLIDLDDFHNVVSIGASYTQEAVSVYLKTVTPTVNVFNKVTTVGTETKGADIQVHIEAEVASVFAALTGNNKTNVLVSVGDYEIFTETGGGGIGIGSTASTGSETVSFEGFGAMTAANDVVLATNRCDDAVATIEVFGELASMGSFDFSFESKSDANISLTGFNKVTDITGYGFSTLAIRKGYQSYPDGYSNPPVAVDMNLELDIFKELTQLGSFVLDFQVKNSGNVNINFVNGFPTELKDFKKFTLVTTNVDYTREPAMPLCVVPEFKTIVEKAFVDNTLVKYAFYLKMYSRSINDNSEMTDDPHPWGYGTRQDYLDVLLADTCN